MGAIALALIGMLLVISFKLFQSARDGLRRLNNEDDEDHYSDSELLEISTNNWRPL